MEFKERLEQAIKDLGLKQAQVVCMTGKSKASISQYLSGKQVPSSQVQRAIAVALGLKEDFFEEVIQPEPDCTSRHTVKAVDRRSGCIRRLTVGQAAKAMCTTPKSIRDGLIQDRFPWGYGIQTGVGKNGEPSYTFIINADNLARYEGVDI